MRQRVIILLAVLTVCALTAASILLNSSGKRSLIGPVEAAAANITARQVTSGGASVGEVLAGDQVLFRIRTSAGGLSPYQRAQAVANRLNILMNNSLSPSDITTGLIGGQEVVLANDQVVITADDAHARINNTTPSALASTWASRLQAAASGESVDQVAVGEKIVPILSVGAGTRVGGAVVSGSADRLGQVVAVAQVEGQFGNAVRVRVLVPVSTTNVVQNIRRVPGTSVIGLVDIQL